MNIQDFFLLWQDLGLFLYSILKAFLPLPSLEVILVPLCIANPHKWLIYSFIGAAGTFIGGAIGYFIAYRAGRGALKYMASEKDINKGEELMNRYGVLAVFIGGVTPIPDFLLAYLAGFTKMPFFRFATSDAIARLLRSMLVAYSLSKLGMVMDIDRFGTIFSFAIIFILLLRFAIDKIKTKLNYNT